MAFIKQIKVGNNTYDIHKKVTVTIAAADWTAATIDKTVSGMTVNDIVVVSPAPSSIIGARNSVVYCSAIKAGALSFTYSVSKPTAALTFNVLWVQAATTDTDKGAIINTVMGGKIPTGTLNVNSTLSNYDTYLNNVRYINLGAGTIDVADKTVTPEALTGAWDATNKKYIVSQAKKTGETMQSTVTTAGYVSSTVGTKNTGTLTINAPANLEIAKATFTVSGNSVKSYKAGYIPADTEVGAVSTVERAATTISTTANTTDAKLTVTASNNQGTGYVTGSNETASDTITLSVSGATVTATSGNDSTKKVSKSVASGTAGTPKATKGTVSNHSIAVTPSVTNTTGYITGGTKSGTAVTVAASELVSGNKALSSSASDQTNIDVTNYKTVSISKIQKGALSATVSGNITFTPSVSTNMATISKPSSGTEGRDYFSITGSGTTSGTVTGNASVSTEGYVKNETATSDSVTGTIGSNAKKYVKKATITNNTSGGDSPETINRGKQIKIGAGYNPSDLYYIAEAAPTLSGNAAAADVLHGKTFYSNSYTKHTGTMTNHGAVTPAALNPGGSYAIPAGYHNGNGKVTARALINQAKSPTEITVGTAITPDSGKDGLSSVTIPSNATITVASNNTLNIAVPPMSSSVVNYDSLNNEGGANTQLNATVGGGTLNTIDVVDDATANVNVYNTGILNINRVSGTVHSDDLVASNIRSGASILGVVGTYVASSTASDIYKAQYAGNISSGWYTYWYSSEGNMGSNWEFTEPLSTPIPQGASVRLKYNDFGPNFSSGAGFKVYLVSDSGTTQLIAGPSAYESANGPHTSSEVPSNFVATKIKVEKSSGAGETVSTYQLLAVEVYVNVPSGYYGVTAANGGSTLADVSSYQYMAVKKATLGNEYTPSTVSQSVKVKGEGWVKTSDTVATIKPISTETQTVTLSLASGNQTVHANDGKYMTSVTINKPSTLVAGNIKSGVNIAGVIGTYSAPPATDPAVKFLGLYLYTQRGSAANPAVLENVTGCQFAGVNRRFGASAYVGCFGLFAFKGTPTIKPCLFDADGLVIGESSAVPLSDLLNDPGASRTVSLYDLLNGITKYEQNIDYNQIYLAPMALTTNENDWGLHSPYYWQAMGVGDSSSTYVYIKNLGSKCMSLNYND